MIDYSTKYVEAVPLPDRRDSTVAHAIMQEGGLTAWSCGDNKH